MACNRENPKPPIWREDRAVASDDPVDLLRAMDTAEGFSRTLAQERLCLTKEAMHSWNELARRESGSADEARQHLRRLQQLPDPVRQWSEAEVTSAWKRRDAAALTSIARAFPTETTRYFEKADLLDREGARAFASVLGAQGERFPQAVVDAMDRTRDRAALEQGIAALKKEDFRRAAVLLERAGNPLHLVARYYISVSEWSFPPLDAVLPHLRPEYPELSSRAHRWRANLLEFDDRYLEAHAEYDQALAAAHDQPTATADVLHSRSVNFAVIGDPERAFRDAHRAMRLLDRVANIKTRHLTYGSAAVAANQLGYPLVALHYQNAAIEDIQRAVAGEATKLNLSSALRMRAEIHIELESYADAERDLERAADLAEAAEAPLYRDLLRMRVLDVRGQSLSKRRPAEAVAAFDEAIALAKEQDSTYRAILHFKRGEATGDANDIATALQILREEVRRSLLTDPHNASIPLWDPYFLRFQDRQDELIESRIAAGDIEGAFVDAELARAFEPMQILLRFRPIETVADLRQARANLPEDTVILQYLVLRQRTYTWVVTRERIVLVQQRATKVDIDRWGDAVHAAVAGKQRDPFTRAMRAVYAELFRAPLSRAASKTRIVIVPDEPMQGLPFNALVGTRDEGYLIERASIATAGSTSLYLYALARDRQLSAERKSAVLLVGDPAFPSFPRLRYAKEEVEELSRDYYPGAEVLIDTDATVPRFLRSLRNASIVHFAGHALANSQEPWKSRLLLASHEDESGELSAQQLMQKIPQLERTRLVVLGACSSAGGAFVGPQGLAPLVRPLIAADVPAVVGSLWNVGDASTKQLLVLLHCHYRHGDDVAVALRNAQLERLRNNESPMAWAAFQVAGYAASPWPRSIALEDTRSEHLCTQNSLHRPDGLHSQ